MKDSASISITPHKSEDERHAQDKLTRTSGENEAKLFATLPIKIVNGSLSILVVGISINATISIASHHHEIFQNVQDAAVHRKEKRHVRVNSLRILTVQQTTAGIRTVSFV